MSKSSSIYPKYRPSGNTVIDSDEVLEAYIGSGEQNKPEDSNRATEERATQSVKSVQRDPPTTSKPTLHNISRMTPSGKSKKGFLPIAMPRPDPPDEADAMSRSSSHFTAPPHIEVRSSSELADDVATEVSDMTYTTEFISEGQANKEKGVAKYPLRKYQALLQEKKNRRASFSNKRLNIVAEERDSHASSSERKVEHIDVTNLDKMDPPNTPIDVTALEDDVQETIDLVGQEPPVIFDATSYGEPIYQPSSLVSEAKRYLALREAKGRLLIKKTGRQEPPSSDAGTASSTTGPPTPRDKSLGADNPQIKDVSAKSTPVPETKPRTGAKTESATGKGPTTEQAAPSLLKRSLRSSTPRRGGPRQAASNLSSTPKPATLSEVSKGMQSNNKATLFIKETVSAEGSVVIDTTNIDEDDIAAMQMLKSDAKEGEAKAVFSFVSTSRPMEPEGVASEDRDEAVAFAKAAVAAGTAAAPEARQPQEEESHFKEFVMFTAGCIQSFASSVNSTVQEKIKEIPPIPAMDLLSDKEMEGMLGALEKGMSERNFIVPTEDEEREMLSNFLEEHITQPVCGTDQPTCGSTDKNGMPQLQVDELIGSMARSYKTNFVNCGITEPKTKKKSKLMDEASHQEFVVPVNYERRRRHSTVKE